MALTCSSCSLTDQLDKASATQGKIAAGVNLPARPVDLAKQEPHAPLVAGAELRSILVAERSALNRANARNVRWDRFYANVRSGFATSAK